MALLSNLSISKPLLSIILALCVVVLMWSSSFILPPSYQNVCANRCISLVSSFRSKSEFVTKGNDSFEMKLDSSLTESSILFSSLYKTLTMKKGRNLVVTENTSEDDEHEITPSLKSLAKDVKKKERGNKGDSTYIPGLLTVEENNLILSSGLTSEIIAQSNEQVLYWNGMKSKTKFHDKPDGAAVFSVQNGSNSGGWIYVSNSEIYEGGVGAITFNAKGKIINYEMILRGTHLNCGGGKTYWDTFITCEENKQSGQIWEVDPFTSASLQRQKPTVLGSTGGSYESFAFDARDRNNPSFYVTNDHVKGGLVRFKPDPIVVQAAETSGDYSMMLHTGMGILEYLVLSPKSGRESDMSGTFKWVENRDTADKNAQRFYRNAEGIDVRMGLLYFTAKVSKSLFILDLDNYTYTRNSTVNESFDGQPDQIVRVAEDDPSNDMLYFCEEGSSSNGIHARDTNGNFYTILTSRLRSETSGLAFSPDKRHMYFTLQKVGLLFDITRMDGKSFQGSNTLE